MSQERKILATDKLMMQLLINFWLKDVDNMILPIMCFSVVVNEWTLSVPENFAAVTQGGNNHFEKSWVHYFLGG